MSTRPEPDPSASSRNLCPRAVQTVVGAALVASLLGCPHNNNPSSARGGSPLPPLPKLHSFSEIRPLTSVAAHSGYVWAGTPWGLLRFDRKTGNHTRLTKKDGLPGNRVYGVTGDTTSGLWVSTNAGLAQLRGGQWTVHKLSPRIGQPTSALAVTGNHVWVGGIRGLGRFTGGAWKIFLPGARVSYMLEDLVTGGVWVGTAGEGVYHFKNDKFVSHSSSRGQDIRNVRAMTYTPDGGLVVVGQAKDRRERLTFYDGRFWASFAVAPQARLNWVQQVDRDVLLSYGNYLLALRRMKIQVKRPGIKLEAQPEGPVVLTGTLSSEAPSGYPVPRFYTEPTGRWLPPNPTAVVGYSSRLLIATRNIGAVEYNGRRFTWYRTNDLLGSAGRLKMACSGGTCYLPGNGRAFRYSSNGFETISVGPDSGSTIHGFVNDLTGGVVALHSPAGGKTIVVSRLVGKRFMRLYEVKGSIPAGEVEVRFIRMDPQGQIWVGIWYQEPNGDRSPWGVAVMRPPPFKAPAAPGSQPVVDAPLVSKSPAGADPAGKVARKQPLAKLREVDVEPPRMYHRSTLLPDEQRAKGSLALPDDIRDVYFDGPTTWLATGLGVCRVRGNEVTLYTENDGLASELVYGLVRAPDNSIMVATYSGVGRYTNKKWYFNMDEPLDSAAFCFIKKGHTLWIGTTRGMVRIKEGKIRIYNETVGLVSNRVVDMFLEDGKRLWVLTDKGVSVMSLQE